MFEYKLERSDAMLIFKTCYSSENDFVRLLRLKSVCVNEVTVPKYNNLPLRVKAVSRDEMGFIKRRGASVTINTINDKELVFGSEKYDLTYCLGTLLSVSEKCKGTVLRTKLQYEYIRLQFQVYGTGYGNHWSVKSDGPNIFCGK